MKKTEGTDEPIAAMASAIKYANSASLAAMFSNNIVLQEKAAHVKKEVWRKVAYISRKRRDNLIAKAKNAMEEVRKNAIGSKGHTSALTLAKEHAEAAMRGCGSFSNKRELDLAVKARLLLKEVRAEEQRVRDVESGKKGGEEEIGREENKKSEVGQGGHGQGQGKEEGGQRQGDQKDNKDSNEEKPVEYPIFAFFIVGPILSHL